MTAPFRLVTLGTIDLRHETRGPVSTLLAQPKRLALLVYLAVGYPGEFCSRDSLLALFWPESDEQKARASLRQALQFLRRALGEEAIRTRGDDAVGIAGGTLEGDALLLRQRVSAGDYPGALELYRGPFLPGLIVDEAPAFDHWLSGERSALRRLALQAATAAAQQAPTPAAAIAFAERAVAIAPEDEPAARQLATLHARNGNRGAALAALERLRHSLNEELGVSLSAESVALAAALRRDAAPPSDASVADTSVADTFVSETSVAVVTSAEPPAASSRPASSRRTRWLVGAVAIAIVVAVVLAFTRRRDEAGARVAGTVADTVATPAPRVVVLPFVDRTGDPRLSAIGFMAADWITGGLSAVDGLAVVPLTAVRTATFALGGDSARGDSIASRVVTDVGATLLVRGVAYRTDGTLHLQAQITSVATGAVLRPAETVSVPLDSVMTGIDRLRTRVVAALAPLGDTVSHLRRAAPPPSYEAYRAYVRGLDTFVQGDPGAALALFESAARSDSSYAMPRIAAAIMLLNLARADEAQRMIGAVGARYDALGPLERATFDMVQGILAGNLAAVDRAVREQARIAPGTIGEYMVAEVARRRARPAEALRVLRSLGPDRGELRGWRPYWRELTGALHMRGDFVAEAAAARAALARYADEPQFHGYLVRALAALGDTSAIGGVVQQRAALATRGAPDVGALWHLAANGTALQARPALRVWSQRAREQEREWYTSRPANERSFGVRWRHARVLALTGHAAEARDSLRALQRDGTAGEGAVLFAGLSGAVSAMLGDSTATTRALVRLDEIERARSQAARSVAEGDVDYWRAVIAAQQSNAERAAAALQRAFAGWRGRDVAIGSDPWFAPVRESAAFTMALHID